MDELHMRHTSQNDFTEVTDQAAAAFGRYFRELVREAGINVVVIGMIADIDPARLYDIANCRQQIGGVPETLHHREFKKIRAILGRPREQWDVLPHRTRTR